MNLSLVILGGLNLAEPLEQLALQTLLLSISNSRRLLEVFALLPLANDAFLLYHALEALDGLFEILTVIDLHVGDLNHLPYQCVVRRSDLGRRRDS